MNKKKFVTFLLILVLSSFFAFSSNGVLSKFSAYDLDGKLVDESYLKQKDVTLVFVWATYCGYCRQEMPTIVKLSEEYDGFQVLGIVTDLLDRKGEISSSQLQKANQIVKQAGFYYPSLIPSTGLVELLKNAVALPYAIFVDKDGNQLGIGQYGMQTEATLRRSIERYLK